MKDREGERATKWRDREGGSVRERELTRKKDSVGAKKTFSQTTKGNVI